MMGWIGISLGDVTGVGLEVTLKALAAELPRDDMRYLLIGDTGYVQRWNNQLGLKLTIEPFTSSESLARLCITNPSYDALPAELPCGSPAAARAAVAWLAEGARRCLRRELDALVTAPVNKEAIVRSGHPFIGQTEFLAQLAGADRTAMMLLGHDERARWLRVALVTTHIPLQQVAAHITRARVMLAIELAAQSCRDLGLPRAR